MFTRKMTADQKNLFDMELFSPPPGSELPPEVTQRLRESEMAAFSALEQQRG